MRNISIYDIKEIFIKFCQPKDELRKKVDSFFRKRFSGDFIITDRGKSAMQACIDDFSLSEGEIIIPAWICSDVFVPLFIQNKITPKIVDCENGSFKMNLSLLRESITKRTKAILLVHTYGIPQDVFIYRKICDENKILLIEDCAHCISLEGKSGYYGSYGDAAIFSFVKEMPNFGGGLYLNNLRKIDEKVKKKVLPSKIGLRGVKLILGRLKIVNNLKNGLSGETKKISPNFEKTVIRENSKLSNSFFIHFIEKLNYTKNISIANKIYSSLPDKGISILPQIDFTKGSGKCLSFRVKNKQKVLDLLKRQGFNAGKGWVPSFSTNPLAKKRWILAKAPNAERYEREIINLDLDELEVDLIPKIINCLKD